MKSKLSAIPVGLFLSMGICPNLQADLLDNLIGNNPIAGEPFPGSSGLGGNTSGGTNSNAGSDNNQQGDTNTNTGTVDNSNIISELEPNDNPDSATALQPGSIYGGRFQSSQDQDWFHFQANSSNSIIEVSVPGSENAWTLSLLDGDEDILAVIPSQNKDQKAFFVLPKRGDYFIRLTSDDGAGGTYYFSVSGEQIQIPLTSRYDDFIQQSQYEVEPNNHIAAAVPIEPGIPVSGQLFSLEDEDWFALQNTQPDSLVNIEIPVSPSVWQIAILDESGNVLEVRESSTEQERLYTSRLEKTGTFYIVISTVDDSRDNYTFNITGDALQGSIERNPNANFHDVEIEFNDTLAQASALNSAVRIFGQLMTSSDIDIYRLESGGDEILSVDLCPGNAACSGQMSDNKGPWVVYIFDGAKVNEDMLHMDVPLATCLPGSDGIPGTDDDLPGMAMWSHLYLSLNKGLLDDALLGVIDPAFGVSGKVEVGLKDPGDYYLVVSSPLKRNESGSVILEKQVECGSETSVTQTQQGTSTTKSAAKITEEFLVIEPYSDDQYELQVVQTSLTPSVSLMGVSKNALSTAAVNDGILILPVVEKNGMEYRWELRIYREDGKLMYELLESEPIGTVVTAADTDSLKKAAMRATLEGHILHVPVVEYNGHYYSADLRMIEENDKTLFELIEATLLN